MPVSCQAERSRSQHSKAGVKDKSRNIFFFTVHFDFAQCDNKTPLSVTVSCQAERSRSQHSSKNNNKKHAEPCQAERSRSQHSKAGVEDKKSKHFLFYCTLQANNYRHEGYSFLLYTSTPLSVTIKLRSV